MTAQIQQTQPRSGPGYCNLRVSFASPRDRSRIERPRRLASLNLGKCRKGIEGRVKGVKKLREGERKGKEGARGKFALRLAKLRILRFPRGSSESFSGPSASLVSVRIASSARGSRMTRGDSRARAHSRRCIRATRNASCAEVNKRKRQEE